MKVKVEMAGKKGRVSFDMELEPENVTFDGMQMTFDKALEAYKELEETEMIRMERQIMKSGAVQKALSEVGKKAYENLRNVKYRGIGEDYQREQYINFMKNKKSELAVFPEWRKVGEWVTYYEDNRYKYFKIAKIELNRLYSEDGKFSLMCDVGKARLRPYNAEEMKSLVGKVVIWSDKPVLVTDYKESYDDTSFIRLGDRGWYDAKDLYENEGFITVDGSPCGVLEHLNENGEWVE